MVLIFKCFVVICASFKSGVLNLLLVAGQILICKFTSVDNRCSNQSDVLMQLSLKILSYGALKPDFLISVSKTRDDQKKGLHSESGSDKQFSSPKSGVLQKKSLYSDSGFILSIKNLLTAGWTSLDKCFLKSFAVHLEIFRRTYVVKV